MGRHAKCSCELLQTTNTYGGFTTICTYDKNFCFAVKRAEDGLLDSFVIVNENECKEHRSRCTYPLDEIDAWVKKRKQLKGCCKCGELCVIETDESYDTMCSKDGYMCECVRWSEEECKFIIEDESECERHQNNTENEAHP